MSLDRLTEEQRKTVLDRGGELLVSAAAGSGKTRVLVERLLDRITQEGLDIDRFLVITFTRAAAAELRGRIAAEMTARLAEDPGNGHLRRQVTLVYQAQISTIHSFCSAVLRENGNLIDLDPDFRLCDEGESQVIMARVLDEMLEKRYEDGEDPDFLRLVDTMSPGRDDSMLASIVLDIYTRVQSHPDPEGWLRDQKKVWELEGITDAAQTQWGAELLAGVKEQAAWCAAQLREVREQARKDELLNRNFGASLDASLEQLEKAVQEESWDGVWKALEVPYPRFGTARKRKEPVDDARQRELDALREEIRARREMVKEQTGKLRDSMLGSSAELLEDMRLTAPAVRTLMDLVKDFMTAFSQEKRRLGILDFTDLEHQCLRLLTDDSGEPSETALSWAARFDEVLVDEYQDTNQVQNAIFQIISGNGRRLFQVGDVKQSIYRFRLADPTIFLDKFARFKPGDEAAEGEPRKRILSRNFRSRPQILEGCNDLFRSIMSPQLGEIAYTEEQALVPGAAFPDAEGSSYAIEADLIDVSFLKEMEEDEASDYDKVKTEARFVAGRIQSLLLNRFQVSDGRGGTRDLRPSDIMILLRSSAGVVEEYRRALTELAIPWDSDTGGSIFDTPEVMAALSILQIVDNPRQDVPLIAALRSPVYGFTGDELAKLRKRTSGDFYSAVVKAAREGDGKCAAFLQQLQELRFDAGDRSCRQMVWHIYERTNLLGIYGAIDAGEELEVRARAAQRQANLLALYDLAGQMEDAGCRTLFQFLLRLQKLQERGVKLETRGTEQKKDGVSLLTVHKSKGLEKPVVFVCGLSRNFNRRDTMAPVLFHPVLGVGPRGLDGERMISYDTLARTAVARRLDMERMSEEMRLLYVAMTRAKEKLILTMTLKDGMKTLSGMSRFAGWPLSPAVLSRRRSLGEWVLLHLLSRPESAGLRAEAGLPPPPEPPENLGPPWEIRFVDGITARLERPPVETVRSSADAGTDSIRVQELQEKFTWQYPRTREEDIPSALTVTQLKGRVLDVEAAEGGVPLLDESYKEVVLSRPDFVACHRGLTPMQRGSAIHLAMQYVDLKGDLSVQGLKLQVQKLVQDGFLSPLQAQTVSVARMAAFFRSRTGREMLKAEEVRREFKFSLMVPAERFYPDLEPGEEIYLQGVADLWFGDSSGITVVDFKTDSIQRGEEKTCADRYASQLLAYSDALSVILQRPVKHRILWFFATGQAVELEPAGGAG